MTTFEKWQVERYLIMDCPDRKFKSLSSGEYAFYQFIMKLSDSYYQIAIKAFPRFYDRVVMQAREYAQTHPTQ